MADRATVVVVGGERGIGRGVAGALAARGRSVAVVAAADGTDGGAAGGVDLTDPTAVRAALEAADAADAGGAAGPVGLVVLAHLDPSAFVVAPLAELGEPAWEAAAERPLRAAFVVLQQVHSVVPDGSRVVVLLPTVAASGVAGLVALCTAVEGIRVMAKAVARRWGARRITVNTIEVDLAAFVSGDGAGAGDGDDRGVSGADASRPTVAQLGTAALSPGSAVADVVGLVEMLDSDAGAALTGALLVADRGTVMLP